MRGSGLDVVLVLLVSDYRAARQQGRQGDAELCRLALANFKALVWIAGYYGTDPALVLDALCRATEEIDLSQQNLRTVLKGRMRNFLFTANEKERDYRCNLAEYQSERTRAGQPPNYGWLWELINRMAEDGELTCSEHRILIRHYLWGERFCEIASAERVSEAAVKKSASRAYAKIRCVIGAEDH